MDQEKQFSSTGYMENHLGYLIPLNKVDPIDLARDELVKELVKEAKETQAHLSRSKKRMMGDVAAFVSVSAEEYGVKYGGDKGNVTLLSYDGRYRISRAMADNITFDERLNAARELINQCLHDWTEGSPDDLRAIIDAAFDRDKEGKLSPGRILGLRRLKLKDPRWREAMEAISDSVQVTGSKAYIRVYERDATGKYQAIPLDMAAI